MRYPSLVFHLLAGVLGQAIPFAVHLWHMIGQFLHRDTGYAGGGGSRGLCGGGGLSLLLCKLLQCVGRRLLQSQEAKHAILLFRISLLLLWLLALRRTPP